MKNILLTTLLFAFSTGNNVHSQTLCTFPANNYTNRCEGFEQLQVRASFYLSSFKCYQRFNYEEDDKLYVHFYQPKAGTSTLGAKLIREMSKHYAMQAKNTTWDLGWQSFGPWPVNDFLIPNGIQAGNLGLLIKTNENLILPAHLSKKTENSASFRKYRVHFYTPTDISTLNYQVIEKGNDKVILEENEEDFPADESFSLRFEMPVSAKSGTYTLLLTMVRGNGRRLIKKYSFYHQP